MFLRFNSYLRAVLDVFGQALQQLLKEEESIKEHEEGGKGGKEEDNREKSCPRINELVSFHVHIVNYMMLWSNKNDRFRCIH